MWTREPRRPKASGLDRDQIVRAAIELLDHEGLEALSMRKLGAALGAGATSLYWYVANKDELLELALDEFWGGIGVPDPDEMHWRNVITAFAYNMRISSLAHPWGPSLIGTLPSVGPNAFRLTDRLRRAFLQAGLTGVDLYLANSTVLSFVLGQVIPEITFRKALGGGEYDQESTTEALTRLAAEYPDMLDARAALEKLDPNAARAMAFDFGLTAVLDGIAAKLPQRSAQPQRSQRGRQQQ
ncbi:TetR/AcrR family transcriptional regulator C-terminal domain-containing protein [Nocardia arthritidis]|uniref:TetR family transcriptional regulator n=1 Tax=Nocardia arthritidis TaxID=228602 RepID=A0A6G9YP93_9NOCA|nr:TetR/AcrR family transcriptional regulator C-terminal domain-containing protein [Nocardia arthritidis]QIS15018.1 TetR family transcriptional regulator [Nocardia arthritidis]